MRVWYQSSLTWWLWLLWPLRVVFSIVSATRRWLYRHEVLSSSHPGVCTLVVGNLSVGGNGKTPVVIAVAEHFAAQGWRPGILSRGYGGQCRQFPHRVGLEDTASWVGDEPLLIARRTHCPVVIDPIRIRGARALIEQHGCNLLICDDGLQHYALQRDIELVVMDERQLGNGQLLPMGPLREGPWRLKSVTAVVHNGAAAQLAEQMIPADRQFRMTLQPQAFRKLTQPEVTATAAELNQAYSQLHAIAGIGYPARFFNTLQDLGINISTTRAFNDHHQFVAADVPAAPVVMTEKDAVKVTPFAHTDAWYLPVSAALPAALYATLEQLVRQFASTEKKHGNKHKIS